MKSTTLELPTASTTQPQLSATTAQPTPRTSAALQRLMDEVRFDESNGSSAATAYDRAHNRHNRS